MAINLTNATALDITISAPEGVGYVSHREGRRALRDVARSLGLKPGQGLPKSVTGPKLVAIECDRGLMVAERRDGGGVFLVGGDAAPAVNASAAPAAPTAADTAAPTTQVDLHAQTVRELMSTDEVKSLAKGALGRDLRAAASAAGLELHVKCSKRRLVSELLVAGVDLDWSSLAEAKEASRKEAAARAAAARQAKADKAKADKAKAAPAPKAEAPKADATDEASEKALLARLLAKYGQQATPSVAKADKADAKAEAPKADVKADAKAAPNDPFARARAVLASM